MLLLLSAKTITAQTVDISTLEQCASRETQELKLACFEAITATTGKAPADQVPEVAVVASPKDESVGVSPGFVNAGAPETPPAAIEFERDLVKTRAAPEVKPKVSVMPSDTDIGREQLAAANQEQKKEGIKAMVVDVTQGYSKSLNFHLANGQIWRQIEPRRLQYPKDREFEIHITQGIMGDSRMRIGDSGRMVRIRRVQ